MLLTRSSENRPSDAMLVLMNDCCFIVPEVKRQRRSMSHERVYQLFYISRVGRQLEELELDIKMSLFVSLRLPGALRDL